MPTIYFHEGPCDLQTEKVSDTFHSDSIECGKVAYTLILRQDGDFIAIPPDAIVNTTFGLPGVGSSSVPDVLRSADALSAWDNFAKALTHTLPASLRRAGDAIRQIGGGR